MIVRKIGIIKHSFYVNGDQIVCVRIAQIFIILLKLLMVQMSILLYMKKLRRLLALGP